MSEADRSLLYLDEQLCFWLYAASRSVTRAYKPLLVELGLTYPQYIVMMVLWQWEDQPPEESTVSALGERLLLDSGTLTPLLKRLESDGLVVRRRSDVDERRMELSLTDRGAGLRWRALAIMSTVDIEGALPGIELGPLRDSLKQLVKGIE